MPPTTRKPAAKKAAPKKRAARAPITAPKPPAAEPAPVEPQEGPAPVSDENTTPENEGDDKPKRGRKPNVVGQANARFQKARTRLDRAEKKAAKVQSVNDELAAAKAEFEDAQREYREAFEASLNNSVPPADDDGDADDES